MELNIINKNIKTLILLGKRTAQFDAMVNETLYGVLEHATGQSRDVRLLERFLNTLAGVARDSKERIISESSVVDLCSLVRQYVPHSITYTVDAVNPAKVGKYKKGLTIKPLENIDFMKEAVQLRIETELAIQLLENETEEVPTPAPAPTINVIGSLPEPKAKAKQKTPAEKAVAFEQQMLAHIETMTPANVWALVEQRILGAGNVKFLEDLQASITKELDSRSKPAAAPSKKAANG